MTLSPSPTAPSSTFQVIGPIHPEPVAEYPVHGAADVLAATERARSARSWWTALSAADRAQRMTSWADWCEENAFEIVDLAHRESGRPRPAIAAEVEDAVEAIRTVGPPRALTSREVVGILSGDEVDLSDVITTMAWALCGGSAVVVDVARTGATTGVWCAESFARAVFDAPPGLAGWVTSSPETRDAVTSQVDLAVLATARPSTSAERN